MARKPRTPKAKVHTVKLGVKKTGSWEKAMRGTRHLALAYRTWAIEAVSMEAKHFLSKVRKSFRTSGASNGKPWEPHAPLTTAFSKPKSLLINSKSLFKGIKYEKIRSDAFAVHVPPGARTSKGEDLVKVGWTHEAGATIVMKITTKQHRFFMARLRELNLQASGGPGKGNFKPGAVLTITIPQRSFLQATQVAHFTPAKSTMRIQRRLAMLLRRQYQVI